MDMCNSTTTSGPSGASKWVLGAGKDAYDRANAFSKTPFKPYNPVARVAPLSGMQHQGLGQLSSYATSGQPNVFGDVTGRLQAYGDAPASSVGTERIVDEGGRLGNMSDYINPNVAATLDPTLRNINEQATTQRQRLAGSAASSGAFGDARHGVLEGGINRDTNQAVSDATSRAYSDAWNNAMGARAGDLGRFMQADTQNGAFNEQALGRQAAAASGISSAADAEQTRKLSLIQSLLAGGGIQQQTAQNLRDARYSEFQRKSQDPYDKFNLLLSAFGKPNTIQTQTSQPNNGLASLLGSLGGAAIGKWG